MGRPAKTVNRAEEDAHPNSEYCGRSSSRWSISARRHPHRQMRAHRMFHRDVRGHTLPRRLSRRSRAVCTPESCSDDQLLDARWRGRAPIGRPASDHATSPAPHDICGFDACLVTMGNGAMLGRRGRARLNDCVIIGREQVIACGLVSRLIGLSQRAFCGMAAAREPIPTGTS